MDGYGDGTDWGSGAFSRKIRFEMFVRDVMERDREIEVVTASLWDGISSKSPAYEADLVARRLDRPLLVAVRLTTPQTSRRLEELGLQLAAAGRKYAQRHREEQEPELVLAFPGVLARSGMAAATRKSLEIWDGPRLRDWADRLGVEVPPGVATDTEDLLPGGDLVARLQGIRPGRQNWSAYEKYCEDLLTFLFVPPLNPPIPQSRDEQNVNRRDYILPNYAMDGGFWQFMRTHYDAHLVVTEVKNLGGEPGKNEVLQVANYLNPRGTGLFALILARQNLGQSAWWTCREQWVQHRKLIVGLSDEDVIQMVSTKLAGNDPAELVRQKIEDFRLGI